MIDASYFEWKKYIIKCLFSTEYLSLATVDEYGVWSNPVYFAWDKEFNIYFISQMTSRHMQNLKKNNSVAVSIYKTEQKGDVCGVQLQGKAYILEKEEEIKNAFEVYYSRAGKGEDVQGYINNPTWIFVKIVAESFNYFDTRFFGEERQAVPLNQLLHD